MTRNGIRVRISNNADGEQSLKMLLNHPMETGFRRNTRTSKIVAADYIEEVIFFVDGEKYFKITLGENVSKNPYISFVFAKQIYHNQKMVVSWIDNNKRTVAYDFFVELALDSTFNLDSREHETVIQTLSSESKPVCKITIATED